MLPLFDRPDVPSGRPKTLIIREFLGYGWAGEEHAHPAGFSRQGVATASDRCQKLCLRDRGIYKAWPAGPSISGGTMLCHYSWGHPIKTCRPMCVPQKSLSACHSFQRFYMPKNTHANERPLLCQ